MLVPRGEGEGIPVGILSAALKPDPSSASPGWAPGARLGPLSLRFLIAKLEEVKDLHSWDAMN